MDNEKLLEASSQNSFSMSECEEWVQSSTRKTDKQATLTSGSRTGNDLVRIKNKSTIIGEKMNTFMFQKGGALVNCFSN